VAAYESHGRRVDAGLAVALIGELLTDQGESPTAIELMRPCCDSLEDVPGADEAVFLLLFNLGRAYGNHGDPLARAFTERALIMAEARQDWGVVAGLLNRMYVSYMNDGCPTVALALLRAGVDLARRHRQPRPTVMGLLNLTTFLKNRELDQALVAGREAVETSLQAGRHDLLPMAAMNLVLTLWVSGDWDEAEAVYEQLQDALVGHPLEEAFFAAMIWLVRTSRTEPDELAAAVAELDVQHSFPTFDVIDYVEPLLAGLRAQTASDDETAARELIRAADSAYAVTGIDDDYAILWPLAVESALAVGQTAEVERLLRHVADAPLGLVTPLTLAHLPRLRALLAIALGADDATIDADLELATQELRAFGARFYLGRVLLERANRLADRGDVEAASPLLAEAEQVFVGLKANRWISETRRVGSLH
jgi:hypothetical protein